MFDRKPSIVTKVGKIRSLFRLHERTLTGEAYDWKRVNEMRPTPKKPLLVGILVDVSGSMTTSIENVQGKTTTRLDSFRNSLDDLVRKAKELSQEGDRVAPLVKIFAYGFGFGNLFSQLFGSSGPPVRDLLELPNTHSSAVTIDKLSENWAVYKHHIEGLASQMLGSTPMGEGFRMARDRFRTEMIDGSYSGQPVLFVLSDGEPKDASEAEIVQLAKQIRGDGIIIVSCYVTDKDVAESRRLYGVPLEHWSKDTTLMFECASILPEGSTFHSYLLEYRWIIEPEGRLFTQINQTEVLSEFMQAVLSPLRNTDLEDSSYMDIVLTNTEIEIFKKALLSAFRRNDLEQVVFYGLDRRFDEIVASSNYDKEVNDLVLWVNDNNKVKALINKARERNRGNVELREFDGYLKKKQLGEKIDVPKLDPLKGKKSELISLLSRLPSSDTYLRRNSLLNGIPGADTINRDENSKTMDLDFILTDLAKRGPLSTGELPVVKLISNALGDYAPEFEVEQKLKDIKEELKNN